MKEATTKKKFDPFEGPEIISVIQTTQAQKEIWTACTLGGKDANRAYNESISLLLKGELEKVAMEQAVQSLVDRHESLRAVFSTDGRLMSIFGQLPISLFFKDLSSYSLSKKENFIEAYLKENAQYSFDLVKGPLLKVGLVKLSELEYQLVITAHHIICDGWSLGIILQELGAIYSSYINNLPVDLPEPERFSDYASRQRELKNSKEYQEIEEFWFQKHKKPITNLDLPIDFPRPQLRTYESQRMDFRLDANLLTSLKKTGLQAGCSLVTTLLATFEVFLYQLSGEKSLVVGLPAAGQSFSGMKHLVGHCANLLPLRSTINPDISFMKYLKQCKVALLDAYEHQQLSFGELLKNLSLARDPARVPLVPIVFNVDLGMADGVEFSNLSYELKSNPRQFEIFEIFINASGSEENLIFEWSYNTTLFKPTTIKKMMASFEDVLQRVSRTPTETLRNILKPVHTTAYAKLNSTEAEFPDLPLHELLKNQALITPNRTAVKFKDVCISYENLQGQANQLAQYLHSQKVRPGDLVGVCLPRSSKMLITLMAIHKCGAAYLPLDPSYPTPRLEFMLEDSEAKVLFTTSSLSNSFTLSPEILLIEKAFVDMSKFPKTPPDIKVSTETTAYLLYTSGSTGKPKGVPVSHRSLVNLLCSIAKKPGIAEKDKLLAITTISFDIAGVELYLPLSKGACVVIADTETAKDGRQLMELLKKENISILQATPTTWNMLLGLDWDKPLKLKAFCGGEVLRPKLAQQLLSKCESLWNMYGPTETTIYSLVKQISTESNPICIGKPIANTQLYILNEQEQLVAPGIIGEIAIAGEGVSTGYWKRPELNKEKFIQTSYTNDDTTLYRTGDLGILLPTGDVQCLGRLDRQVKIRGHRIELGEIEQVLSGLEEVQTAVVLAQFDHLIAYVVPAKRLEIKNQKIRKELSQRLPSYLVPKEFKILKTLPTTPNGKIDRKVLQFAKDTEKPITKIKATPSTNSEKLIASIWQEYLGLDEIDVSSNFFELGGHSIKAVQVMARIEKETGKRLPASSLFEYSTVKKLAMLLDMEDNNLITGDSLVHIKPNGSKPPLYLIHGVGLNIMKLNDLAKKLDSDQPVYGLQGTGVNGKGISLESVEAIAEHYIAAIKKLDPEGPYSFAGHSYGGIIAFEMARQLVKNGKKVDVLIMLDTYLEPYFHYSSKLNKKIAELDYFTKRMISLGKDMSQSWTSFKFHLNRKKEEIWNKYRRTYKGMTKQQKVVNRKISQVSRNNDLMMKRYHIVPQDFEINLLRAQEKTYFRHDPVYLGWKNIALKGLHIFDVPGTHEDLFSPPNDLIAANILQEILDRRNQ